MGVSIRRGFAEARRAQARPLFRPLAGNIVGRLRREDECYSAFAHREEVVRFYAPDKDFCSAAMLRAYTGLDCERR